jgi:hypothetical protein
MNIADELLHGVAVPIGDLSHPLEEVRQHTKAVARS